jgi:hypothetical protein
MSYLTYGLLISMQVFEFVKLKELYYAGSHGMDIMAPSANHEHSAEKSKQANLFQPAHDFLPMIDEVHFSFNFEVKKLYCSIQFNANIKRFHHLIIIHINYCD